MKLSSIAGLAVLAASPHVAALREIANPAVNKEYTSGAVMDSIMEKKFVSISLPF